MMLTRDEKHVYRWDGIIVPGVTGVIGPADELWRVPPDVLARKADLGRRVHLATELDDEDDLDEFSIEDDVAPYLEGWRKFKREKRPVIESSEEYVFHPTYRYAGQLDRVMRMDGFRWLVDLKTCVDIYPSVGPQTAAYLQAKGDHTITRRAAMQLKPDGTYRFVELNSPMDWPAFLALLTIHNFKESHK